ncbi:MAG: hypothetical protein GTO53_01785 [Planctomycetales bacterium]|nr:hypothetical protein [Planctomycetales bacterium]NIN07390.1 hypothetical protein [Planctomycetales bacterium]NIO33684.1 hypothetical protein [Planctomycetales bacterium]NIO45491.1 hypothetical protein [Planctomycetales bacterium]NIP03568.1 hypothetical protein [Planctomycetales bacterium]
MSLPSGRRQLAFQFRLRTLLCAVAGCSALFATMMYVGPFWGLAMTFVVVMVGAHVAGNAIGTSLRARATVRRVEAVPSVPQPAPLPRLQHRTPGGKLTLVFTLAGAACGVLLGRLLFAVIDRGQLSRADWLLGLASFAVIAGWLGFLASSFVRIGCVPAAICFFQRQAAEPPSFAEGGGEGLDVERRDLDSR